MSESKRPVGNPRAPKKKTRPKSAPVAEAVADERETQDLPEASVATEPAAPVEARAPEAIAPAAIIPTTVGGEGRIAPPPSREESEFEDEDYDREDELASEQNNFSESPRRDAAPAQPRRDPQGQPRRDGGGPKARPTDEYLVQVYFDKGARAFLGTVLEFPELKATGNSRESVLRDLDAKIDNLLQGFRRRNEPAPEGYFNRRTPEKLEVKVSQSLFRKLDLLAKAEKVPMDQIVSELLTTSLQRSEPPRQQQQPGSNQGRDRDRQPHSNQGRHGGGQPQPGNSRNSQPRQHGRNRNYHDTMDNRENFMEYVRNLEKGNWRKK